MGSVYARLGSDVTVVEYLDQITPGMDLEICKTFQKMLTKQGLKFVLGAAVQGVETAEGKSRVAYKLRKDDSEHSLDADVVLVATGRRPYTEGLGLEALGRRADQARSDRDRRAVAHQRRRRLRHRRRDRRADARAQGRGRGHRGGRGAGRQARPRQLRGDPERDLHQPRGRHRSARPRRRSRRRAGPTRSASSPSSATPGPSRISPATASSSSSPTRRPTASSAPTSSAR